MKKIITASLILVLVPTIIFVPIYALMIHSANNNAQDFSEDVIGCWTAFQYYYDSKRFVCDDKSNMTINLDAESISISGNILCNVDTSYKWKSGTTIEYEDDTGIRILYFSFDSKGNMQINTEESEYIILLRKAEG